MDVIERLKKGTSKLTITKLSYNAPAYVRAREQEIELMGIIEQQANQIQAMRNCSNCKIINTEKNCYYKCRGAKGDYKNWEWDGGNGE